MKKSFILTNDVELTSIVNHTQSIDTGRLVADKAIPSALELYDDLKLKSTFFITGDFAESFPEAVKLIYDNGHEIGSHGLTHNHLLSFDGMIFEKQAEHLASAKKILEGIINDEVISFRAPALRTNSDTLIALRQTGFKIDSSIASQRFDFFLSLGASEKRKWLKAPRKPYFTKENDLSRKGGSPLFEIPVSAFIMPYIGTTMRIIPLLNKLLRYLLYVETIYTGRPFNFLIHPVEMILEDRINEKISRRSKNYIKYLLTDVARHKLKQKNLGGQCVALLKKEIAFFKKRGFEFISCREYYERTAAKNITGNH
ncbi:MAG TPA: polysaccharide deacetylase [Actinobacteria bacterium]|nr:polysaccharide deacetylase [Actinomycetota bacterium]